MAYIPFDHKCRFCGKAIYDHDRISPECHAHFYSNPSWEGPIRVIEDEPIKNRWEILDFGAKQWLI